MARTCRYGKLRVVGGDLHKQEADVLVTPANNRLSGREGLDAMVHKEVSDSHRDPDIFLITSKIEEKIINKIIQELESLPENKDKIIKIRVEELN